MWFLDTWTAVIRVNFRAHKKLRQGEGATVQLVVCVERLPAAFEQPLSF